MFGRAKRQGDFGRVDPFYSLEEGSKFYKMVQQLYDPRYNPDLTPKEKQRGKAKFEEFLAKIARLTKIEDTIFDANGRLKSNIKESPFFAEWCDLQNYFTDLLKTVQFEAQKHRDETRVNKMKRDMKIQGILHKVRAYPVRFNAIASKADRIFLEKYLESQLDAVLDIYFEPQRIKIGEDGIGRLDLEECLGIIEQLFHIDLGTAKDEINQLSLDGTSSAELVTARNRLRTAVLSDIKKIGTVFIESGGEAVLWAGNNYYTLRLNGMGDIEIKEAGQLNADREIEQIEVEYSQDRSTVRIGEDTYTVSREKDGSLTLTNRAGGSIRFIKSTVIGKTTVELEGAFASAVKAIYAEGLDNLKKKIIREAREKRDIVETDTSEAGLAKAAIEEARNRYFDERGRHADYASEDGQKEISRVRDRIEPLLNNMADTLRSAEREAENEKAKLRDEGKITDEPIKEDRSVRSVATTAGAEAARDVELAPAKMPEEQQLMATAADTSAHRYSTPGNFAVLIRDTFFEGKDAKGALLMERAQEEAAIDRKDEEERESKDEQDALASGMGYQQVEDSIFIEVPETTEGALSDEQRIRAFGSCPPVREGGKPPLLVIV